MVEHPQKLGLVAIGRNEGERLKLCLRSVPPGVTTIYVDSGSTDGSVAFARSIGAQIVELDMYLPFTAARARNAGLEQLMDVNPDVEYVQFIDGDCELEFGWLETATAFLSENLDIAAVCGRRKERFPQASLYNRMCDEEWDTPSGKAESCGGDAMFRLAVIASVGGYDAAMVAGEEPELCQRLRTAGWSIWRLDEPMTLHDADMHRISQWWMRAMRSGFGTAQVWHKTVTGSGDAIYGRQVASALFWTGGVVLLAAGTAFTIGPAGLMIAPILWMAQFARLTIRSGFSRAAHTLGGKLAEMIGIMRYAGTRMTGKKQGAILYK